MNNRVQRLIQPEALKKNEPLFWTSGNAVELWQLIIASSSGDLDTMKRLLDKDPSLARAWYEYRTALAFAVRENQIEAAKLLLERGADRINSGTPDTLLEIARDRGYGEMQKLLETALGLNGPAPGKAISEAIRSRDAAKVREMLDASPDLVHARDEWTRQPIHWAVMTRQIELIDELLARGADINSQRTDGARPIHLSNGDYLYRGWRDVPEDVTTTPGEVYRHLVARGAEVDMGMACVTGDIERVRTLLQRDPSSANRVSDYGSYYLGCGAPIKNAAAQGHLEIVRLLLEHGADPNLPEEGIAPRGHALYSAATNGHYEIAKLLLEHGAYPNVEVESSADTLSRVISNNDQKMIELLCSYGAARPVHLLAHYNDLQTAAAVFAANPDLADNTVAFGSASESFLRLMLRYKPDLPKRVSLAKSRKLTELLFEHGMDANHPDWQRVTALHRFAESGQVENAAIFIAHGADVNAQDEEFRSTPLGYAAKYGKKRMVEFLLRRGADPNLPADPEWARPLAWATRRGHSEIVQLLTDFAATGKLPALDVAHLSKVADALVDAYATGAPQSVEIIVEHFQIKRAFWDRPPQAEVVARIRRHVNERLERSEQPEALALEDAQLLIARSEGFLSWSELSK